MSCLIIHWLTVNIFLVVHVIITGCYCLHLVLLDACRHHCSKRVAYGLPSFCGSFHIIFPFATFSSFCITILIFRSWSLLPRRLRSSVSGFYCHWLWIHYLLFHGFMFAVLCLQCEILSAQHLKRAVAYRLCLCNLHIALHVLYPSCYPLYACVIFVLIQSIRHFA